MSNERIEELESWRKKIDSIDLELVKLINERARCAEEIGRIKQLLRMDAYSPEREEEIMENVTSANPGPLSQPAIQRVFERIIDESRAVERKAMVSHKSRGKGQE